MTADRPAPHRRPALGAFVAVLGLALVAAPAAAAAFLASASFSGCFLICTEPDPLQGTLLVAVAVTLLAAPLGLGLFMWRGQRVRRAWLATAALAVLLVTGYFLTRGAI